MVLPPFFRLPATALGAWLMARRTQVAGDVGLLCYLAGFVLVAVLCASALGFSPLCVGHHVV